MIDSQNLDRLPGMKVIGSDGENIGKVDEVYVDDATGEPSFALVNTGLFGLKSSFVPLDQAELTGEDLRVAATKDKVKDAPNMDPDGHLSPDDEDDLYGYYGLQSPSTNQTTGTAAETEDGIDTAETADRDTVDRDTVDRDTVDRDTVDRDTSGTTTDDAMTRSEEELHVGTREREVGKARLRKHVVTEHVTKTVPVQREEVHIEREPVDEANIDQATDGPEISEEEHEVTLHEEEPVVEKRTVPKEQVRLEKETHTDQETIEDDVAKEEIDVAGLEESRQDEQR